MTGHRQWVLLLLLQVLCCWGLATASYRVRRQGFALSQRDACIPPGGGTGRCVSVNRCEQIYNIFAAGPIPPHLLDFLRRSICRRDAVGRPMFCCSLNSTSVPQPPTPPPTQPLPPPPTQPPTQPPTDPPIPPPSEPPTNPPSEVTARPLDTTLGTTVVVPAAATGDTVPAVASGDTVPAAATGDTVPAAASGDTVPAAASGDTVPAAASGDTVPAAASGDTVPAAASGDTMRVMTGALASGTGTSSLALDGLIPSYTNCGNSDAVLPRIVGGRLANKGDWPWLAALGYSNSRGVISYSCGAALITRRHVLTAAHCVDGQPSLRIVRLGEHDTAITTEAVHEDYNITKKVIHEGYNSNFRNDIAILELDRDVVFKKHISPICLPRPEIFPNPSLNQTRSFVAGWGSISFNNRSSNLLRDVFVPLVNNDECRESYKRFGTVTVDERILCAGLKEGGKDACQGDSGGPLMFPYQPTLRDKSKYFLIGVVSLGYRCAEPGYPGIYSKVTYYMPWVLDKLNSTT